jgi:hypothetical protein
LAGRFEGFAFEGDGQRGLRLILEDADFLSLREKLFDAAMEQIAVWKLTEYASNISQTV